MESIPEWSAALFAKVNLMANLESRRNTYPLTYNEYEACLTGTEEPQIKVLC